MVLDGLDVPRGPVDGYAHPGPKSRGGVAAADDGGNPVFAGDDRGVGRCAPDIGDDAGRESEERRPRGCREGCDENLTGLKVGELVRTADDADGSARATG